MERIDIFKIRRKVLNSAYHEEQAVEVLRKSAYFSFSGVKGLTWHIMKYRFYPISATVADTRIVLNPRECMCNNPLTSICVNALNSLEEI